MQWGRKATLLLLTGPTQGNNPSAYLPNGDKGLDLSNLHFSFQTAQQDVESPNNCSIRIYNLSDAIVQQVRGEFSRVILQAGYDGQFGVVFDGIIKQFRIGRQNATDTYLDILAADGDMAYNWSTINTSLAAGSKPADRVRAITDALRPWGVTPGPGMETTGGVLPRGKVLFGLPRAFARMEAENQGASWSIQNGQFVMTPLTGYKPDVSVVLNAATGLIGIPEATAEGVRFRCLLNPKLQPGCTCQIDNKSINRTVAQAQNPANVAFNSYQVQNLANVTTDGLYRVLVVEHSGDTRGQGWYSDVVGLAVSPDTQKVKING
jgi:hypothetical protein